MEDNLRRLTDELLKTIKFYNSNHPENPLSPTIPLLLTGELSADATSSQLIQAKLGHPVELLTLPLKLPPDLPIALYATNIGLSLKKGLLKAISEGDSIRFNDINLNILSGAYGTSAGWLPLRRILISVASIISIALLLPMYQVSSQADVETKRLQTEYTRVTTKLQEAKTIEDTIDEIAADVGKMKQEHQYILSKGGDFANNLELVTNAFMSGADFTSVEIDTDQITLEGVADNSFTVIDYTMALETSGKFSEVRIAQIDDRESTRARSTKVKSTGVSFTIVIRK